MPTILKGPYYSKGRWWIAVQLLFSDDTFRQKLLLPDLRLLFYRGAPTLHACWSTL